jgi:hypothetical protein
VWFLEPLLIFAQPIYLHRAHRAAIREDASSVSYYRKAALQIEPKGRSTVLHDQRALEDADRSRAAKNVMGPAHLCFMLARSDRLGDKGEPMKRLAREVDANDLVSLAVPWQKPDRNDPLPSTIRQLLRQQRWHWPVRGYGVLPMRRSKSDDTDLCTLMPTIKAHYLCDSARQQMKQELGLNHFEVVPK